MKTQCEDNLTTQTLSQCKFGAIGLLSAFSAIMVWAYFAPLSSAVVASGTLKNDGHRHVIQHPESAITESVAVNDGDAVKAGDTLIILDTSDLRAADLSLKIEYLQIKLEKNRHYANINRDNQLLIPSELISLATEIDQLHRPALEISIWKEDQRKLGRQVELLSVQKRRLIDDLTKERTLHDYWQTQISLLDHDQSALLHLSEQSMVSRSQKSKVDRAMIELRKNLEISRHSIERLHSNITEIPREIEDTIADARQVSLARYQSLDRQEPQVVRQLAIIRQKIQRSTLTAPVDGRVNGLTVSAAGGTIQANTRLLEIIPDAGKIIVEARISTHDIDSLTGLEDAKVRLTALNPRHHQPLPAKIQSISADILHDSQGKPFYRMQLALDPNSQTPLYPGMSTEVFIATGKFSTFDFLIGRLIQASEHGLRETL